MPVPSAMSLSSKSKAVSDSSMRNACSPLLAWVTRHDAPSRKPRATAATAASSSTNSTRRPAGIRSRSMGALSGAAATRRTSGRYNVTRVPCPGELSIVTAPCDCLTKPYTVLRPRPVPRPDCLVVKNGSNARSFTSSGMPAPLSTTAIDT